MWRRAGSRGRIDSRIRSRTWRGRPRTSPWSRSWSTLARSRARSSPTATPTGSSTPAEGGIAGRVFYIDANNDGHRDADDPATLSDAEGRYTFQGLAAGTYVVRQDTAGDTTLVPTSPSGGAYVATVSASVPMAAGTAAGNLSISPVSPVRLAPQSFPQGPADAATKFVQGVYRGVLGRDLSASELASDVARLNKANNARTRNRLAQSAFNSGAHVANEVQADYQAAHRPPGDPGRTSTPDAGVRGRRRLAGFGGPGSRLLVVPVANGRRQPRLRRRRSTSSLLGRAPTNAELSALTGKLANHRYTAAKAAQAVLTSADGAGLLVDSLYVSILHRQADAASRSALVDQIVGGRTTIDRIAVDLLASAEYFARAQSAAGQG